MFELQRQMTISTDQYDDLYKLQNRIYRRVPRYRVMIVQLLLMEVTEANMLRNRICTIKII